MLHCIRCLERNGKSIKANTLFRRSQSRRSDTLSAQTLSLTMYSPHTDHCIDFATKLESSLSKESSLDVSDLEHYTVRAADASQFPRLPADVAHQLDSIGRRIWNICLKKQHHPKIAEDDQKDGHLYTRSRLFGYLLIGLGLPAQGGDTTQDSDATQYHIDLGLTLAKICINSGDLECARIALQKVTEYLPPAADQDTTNTATNHTQHANYYILRIALVSIEP